jgi:NitT/TauT family transport system substrate-binding protein
MLLRLATGRLRIVANVTEPEPGYHKLAARQGINGGADMRGKRLGIAQGTAQHYVTIRYLQISGVQPSEVQLVPLPSLFEIVAALRRGSIDAAWVWAQGTDEASQIPGVRILADDGVVQSPSFGYMAVGAQFLTKNPDVMVNVLRAMVEATDWQNKNLPQSAKIISKRNGAPENTTLVELKRQHAVVLLERKHVNALVSLLDFMIDNNLLKTRMAVPDFFVTRPLQQAAPDHVKI